MWESGGNELVDKAARQVSNSPDIDIRLMRHADIKNNINTHIPRVWQ